MDQRHQEYVEYYGARLKRYENDPMYPHSEAAQRAMYDAIRTADGIEQFGERVRAGHLNVQCAVALVRDHATAEAKFYTEREEHVRAKPHLEILEMLDSTAFDSAEELNRRVEEIHTRAGQAISRDEILRPHFWDDLKALEDRECDERASVPDRWRTERQQAVRDLLRNGREQWQQIVADTRAFHPGWEPDWNQLWETRHRRRMPLSDDVLRQLVDAHRRYVEGS